MNDITVEFVTLTDSHRVNAVRDFLAKFDLDYHADDVDFTMIFTENETIIATGSLSRNILRNIAIDPAWQGAGLAAKVVSELIQHLAERGYFHYFLYTKPETAPLFLSLGLQPLVYCHDAALLEGGIGSLNHYLAMIKQHLHDVPHQRVALVMKCDPFTLGHRYLIEHAAKEAPAVIIFVVSEEETTFSFTDRFALVKAGIADLPNVIAVPTSAYQVSSVTFPTYFTKGEQQKQVPIELDVRLFGEKIAPSLGIFCRYIGEEPFCATTSRYNRTLLAILPTLGIEVKVIPRYLVDGEIISASRVREAWRHQNWALIKKLLPQTTYDYLYDRYNTSME